MINIRFVYQFIRKTNVSLLCVLSGEGKLGLFFQMNMKIPPRNTRYQIQDTNFDTFFEDFCEFL